MIYPYVKKENSHMIRCIYHMKRITHKYMDPTHKANKPLLM